MDNQEKHLTRREVLIVGGGLAGVGAVATSLAINAHPTLIHAAPAGGGNGGDTSGMDTTLPVKQIEDIMGTSGMVMNGVLSIELDRTDLHVIGPGGIPFKPAWEINGEFFFQPLGNGRAILNADIALLPEETNPFIDKLFEGGLDFMAFHQHFFGLNPMVFFIHFRGIGDPIQLAQAAIAAVKVTGTPLPQSMPVNPTTHLDKDTLASILGGTAMIGGSGVVTVSIPRKETIVLAGVALKPETGVSVTVAFEPLENGQTAVAPDLALIASEVNPTLEVLRNEGFEIHCLYNQETAEQPQLYFTHCLASGDAITLAKKLANGLDKMNLMRS